jgi:Cdc6-like AAA superfamily ATPase
MMSRVHELPAADGALLERGGELARIESALAEAREGRGRFVVIEGPAGIGKTTLLAAVRDAATAWAPDDSPNTPRPSSAQPEPARDGSFSPGSTH